MGAAMETFLDPDGKPCVFEEGAYFSHDRRLRLSGAAWVAVAPRRYMPVWLKVTFQIGFVAVLIYAVYAAAQSLSPTQAYDTGFFFGVVAGLAVLGALFWFAGRWGGAGLIVRVIAACLFGLRVIALLARAHS